MPLEVSATLLDTENTKAMDALFKGLLLGPKSVDIGVFQHSKEENGTPTAIVAATHEFGNKDNGGHIPERSFMRSAVTIGRDKINERLRQDLLSYIEGRGTKTMVLNRLGLFVANLIQARIRDSKSWAKELSDKTIAARARATRARGLNTTKNSVTPLIDTGRMIASITYRIDGEQPVIREN